MIGNRPRNVSANSAAKHGRVAVSVTLPGEVLGLRELQEWQKALRSRAFEQSGIWLAIAIDAACCAQWAQSYKPPKGNI